MDTKRQSVKVHFFAGFGIGIGIEECKKNQHQSHNSSSLHSKYGVWNVLFLPALWNGMLNVNVKM